MSDWKLTLSAENKEAWQYNHERLLYQIMNNKIPFVMLRDKPSGRIVHRCPECKQLKTYFDHIVGRREILHKVECTHKKNRIRI